MTLGSNDSPKFPSPVTARLHGVTILFLTNSRVFFLFYLASFAFLCVLCDNALVAGHRPAGIGRNYVTAPPHDEPDPAVQP